MNEVAGFARIRPLSWQWTALLILAFSLGAWAISTFAVPYFLGGKALTNFGHDRRFGLFIHICAAGLALLAGPTQFWMGWTGHYVHLHRKLGTLYVMSVAVACLTAVYLVATTRRGLVFGSGLGALTVAWILATTLAYVAILRRQFQQHWEWMIRSYILTFVFVTFRLMVMAMKALKIGTNEDRLTISIWLCWIGPLLIAEAIMQGRKIFRASAPRRHPFRAGPAVVRPETPDRMTI